MIGATVLTEDNIPKYRALVIANALELYARTRIKANTAYTPRNMLAFVRRTTGKTFHHGQYLEAAQALRDWVKEAGR
jgi:hypothetical protein